MEYRRFGNTIYLRLDPKEEILEEIGKVAEKENIRLAQVTGLGAINDFTAGVYNTVTKEYHSTNFRELMRLFLLLVPLPARTVTFIFIIPYRSCDRRRPCTRRPSEPCHHQCYRRDPDPGDRRRNRS